MSTVEEHDEKACREVKIEKRRFLLDQKLIIAQGGTRLYHRRFKAPESEDEEIVNDHIKQSCISKIMKDLNKHSKAIFTKYSLKTVFDGFFRVRKPLRSSQKDAMMWKKFKRTRAT